MMETTNQSPRCARTSSSVLRCSTVFLLGTALVAAQGRITKPPVQPQSGSGEPPHVATLRSSDSPEGSRVALSLDQGDSTVLSFRLQPGASARVEQRANQLEVVFTVAGAGSSIASNVGRETPRSTAGAAANRNSNVSRRSASPLSANKSVEPNRNSKANRRTAAPVTGNNAAGRSSSTTARNAGNSNSAGKDAAATALASNSESKPSATSLPSPIPSPSTKPTQTAAQTFSSTALASPTTQPTPLAATNQSRQDRSGWMREHINYWLLLAQLNPLPVITGAIVLLLLIALFLLQRRRARSAGHWPAGIIESSKNTTKQDAASSVQPASESKSAVEIKPGIAEAAAVAALASKSKPSAPKPEALPVPEADALVNEDPRRQRIARVNEEAQKLINGGIYDENVIGSPNTETRQLVGAELLAAIVGRSATRREQARAAFMKHGYFDDATRDLRIADSANERAAAARRLSFVHDREATPHLVGALDDPAPDVRRAAVEALMDLRDPTAIGPLNSLMQTENDRKVPRTLIKHAIEACATAFADEASSVAVPSRPPVAIPERQIETEREVIEL